MPNELRPAPPWRPEIFAARKPFLLARGRILNAVRQWFQKEGFLEVDTPALQVCPGMEPTLRPFQTILEEVDRETRPMGLHTSQEFAMKKLLTAGAGPIAQIAHVFRNGERSATHHPEFSMLEWYRPHAEWRTIADDACTLIQVAADAALPLKPSPSFAPSGRVEHVSVKAAFEATMGFDPITIQDDIAAIRAATEAAGIRTEPNDGWDDIFFRGLLNRIEPGLGAAAPVVLHSYPARMAALAKLDAADPLIAERFEVFAGGMELANGFGELTDAEEHRSRFAKDLAEIHAAGGVRMIDEDFLDALTHGMPESAGAAMGFDRLVMLATGASHINDVLWLPVSEPSY